MSESKLNAHLKDILKGKWEGQRLESPLTNTGIPDWIFTLPLAWGVIESKFLKGWPKRKATGIRIDHFTIAQKRFLFCHGRMGGKGAFLLLQIGDDIMLFPWHTVYKIIGKTQSQLRQMHIFAWKKSERKFRSDSFKQDLIHILSTY